jgi:hypothetical protein
MEYHETALCANNVLSTPGHVWGPRQVCWLEYRSFRCGGGSGAGHSV